MGTARNIRLAVPLKTPDHGDLYGPVYMGNEPLQDGWEKTDVDGEPFYVNKSGKPWRQRVRSRRAGTSTKGTIVPDGEGTHTRPNGMGTYYRCNGDQLPPGWTESKATEEEAQELKIKAGDVIYKQVSPSQSVLISLQLERPSQPDGYVTKLVPKKGGKRRLINRFIRESIRCINS